MLMSSLSSARQERLLQGLLAEIIRMTSQKQPLEVGVPLYPFSHATAFVDGQRTGSDGSSPAHAAPLPAPEHSAAEVNQPNIMPSPPSQAGWSNHPTTADHSMYI
jgi:hypothetical protein